MNPHTAIQRHQIYSTCNYPILLFQGAPLTFNTHKSLTVLFPQPPPPQQHRSGPQAPNSAVSQPKRGYKAPPSSSESLSIHSGVEKKKNPPYLPNLSQAAKRYPVLLWSHPNPSSPSRNPPLSSDLSLLTHCPVPDIWNPQKWNASLGTAATACMSSATSLSLQGILVHLLLLQ